MFTRSITINSMNNNNQWTRLLGKAFALTAMTWVGIGLSPSSYLSARDSASLQKVVQKPVKKITIKGTVTDHNGEALPGAVIYVKGTSKGTQADLDGNYTLVLDKPSDVIVSHVGFNDFLITVLKDNNELNFKLEPDNQLKEVVVTGIFNKNKETFTGSVTSIQEKDLVNFRGSNLIATLKNIDPVMNVTANNSLGSNPNALPDLSIRGNASLGTSLKEVEQGMNAQLNAPLIIMDGFEISLQKLMDYNDEDIESMNLLKDASATAIYGSRGANGVIVITTKAPEQGKIKVYVKGGVNIEMPDLSSYNLMNAEDKLNLEWNQELYDDKLDIKKDIALKELYNHNLYNVNRGVNTYWIGQPVRIGWGQKYNINLTGGTNDFRWSATMGYNNISGAMKGSSRNNFNGAITIAYNYRNLMFKNQAMITTNKASESKYGSFDEYARMNQYWPIYDADNKLIKEYEVLSGVPVGNPLYNSTLNTYDISKYTELVNNFSIEWNIIDNLKLRGQLGVSKRFNTTDAFYPAEHTKFKDYIAEKEVQKGEYDYTTGEDFSIYGNATISYTKNIADAHNIYIGADASVRQLDNFSYLFKIVGFPNEKLDFIGSALSYEKNSKPVSREGKSRAVGFTVNANYSYKNRYFIDGSFRTDGSSLFGGNNRFAPFWSAGMGWNIHRESFMSSQNIFSNLKLRASVGESGAQNFSSYQALSTYQYYTDKKYGPWNAAYILSHGNPDLKWQKVFQWNVGLDIAMFDGRVSAALDVYRKNTKDLLSRKDIQASTGFSSYVANIGEISNRGVEAMLSAYLVRNLEKELTWSVTGKIAYNKNTIEKLSDALKKDTEKAMMEGKEIASLLFEGDPVNSIYAVRSKGIDPSTGEEIFLGKDGKLTKNWNAADKVFLGSSDPLCRGNISTLLQWKGLSLNLAFGFYFGGYQYNETLLRKVEVSKGYISRNNVDNRVFEDRWQKPGDVKFFKKIDSYPTKATSRFVMKENTFELQNVTLQYTFDSPKLQQKAKIQSVILGLNVSDVFYTSTIKRERGTAYPFARHAALSVSLTF